MPKIVLFRRKTLAVLACILAAAAIFYAVSYPSTVGAYATDRQLPIYCVQRDQKLVSISFDAAWGNAILRSPILKTSRVLASRWPGQRWDCCPRR